MSMTSPQVSLRLFLAVALLFGRAAPLNLEYQRADRVLPFPFHFLDNNHAMNIRPQNYAWKDFYDHVIDLTKYSFSWSAIAKRLIATKAAIPRWMNVVRALSSEGSGRIKYYTEVRRRLDTDSQLQNYFAQETDELPDFYANQVSRDLGSLFPFLPEGSMSHDHKAYLASEERPLEVARHPELAAI